MKLNGIAQFIKTSPRQDVLNIVPVQRNPNRVIVISNLDILHSANNNLHDGDAKILGKIIKFPQNSDSVISNLTDTSDLPVETSHYSDPFAGITEQSNKIFSHKFLKEAKKSDVSFAMTKGEFA